ncbi:MAG TPA: NAD(+)/NADH kinase [Ignavibacteriales bacterium]|nr:NAD(+)/NADH kinase [Ignavibacteriales bacterium]HOL81329.1 NAD(+)/NADH kinase [Ignavibacteriales bacterium]HOM65445.1 NAD(+)/NADH kinase [Ignavibacteriales bacterium]HPD68297.1 NAD(+)/NADH kinase [Ignavibacteriales bacterium]HPP33902.1 NAD(+)/NADH kinase [Ignavibacteriales bacterium]
MIGIICNIHKNSVINFTKKFLTLLNDEKVKFKLWTESKTHFSDLTDDNFCNIENLCSEADLLISIGGDGTFLFSAYFAVKHDKPIYGLNFGKLGYLAEPEPGDLNLLIKKLLTKNYKIQERILLDCNINNSRNYIAINDIVVDKGEYNKTIDLNLFGNNNFISTIISDGLIVSTPTGSTAYSLACGGPVISPDADVFVLTPIAPHSLTIRPLVLTDRTELTIEPFSRGGKMRITFDGQHDIYIQSYDKIQIKKSQQKLKIIQINQKPYFELLREKLLWGYDYRNKHSQQ